MVLEVRIVSVRTLILPEPSGACERILPTLAPQLAGRALACTFAQRRANWLTYFDPQHRGRLDRSRLGELSCADVDVTDAPNESAKRWVAQGTSA